MKHKIFTLLLAFIFAICFASAGYSHGGWHGGGGGWHHGGGGWNHGGGWGNAAIIGLTTGILLNSMYQSQYYNGYGSYYGPQQRVCGWVGGYYNEYGYWVPRQRACWWQ